MEAPLLINIGMFEVIAAVINLKPSVETNCKITAGTAHLVSEMQLVNYTKSYSKLNLYLEFNFKTVQL